MTCPCGFSAEIVQEHLTELKNSRPPYKVSLCRNVALNEGYVSPES